MKEETIKKKEVKIDLIKLEKTKLGKKQMTHVMGGLSCFCKSVGPMRPAAGAIAY